MNTAEILQGFPCLICLSVMFIQQPRSPRETSTRTERRRRQGCWEKPEKIKQDVFAQVRRRRRRVHLHSMMVNSNIIND